jgi:hypothetical protein
MRDRLLQYLFGRMVNVLSGSSFSLYELFQWMACAATPWGTFRTTMRYTWQQGTKMI